MANRKWAMGFREFLEELAEWNELEVPSHEVNTLFEVQAAVRRSSDEDGAAFLFDHVVNHHANVFTPDDYDRDSLPLFSRVAAGVFSSRKRADLAFQGGHARNFAEAMEKRIKPIVIEREEAPVSGNSARIGEMVTMKYRGKGMVGKRPEMCVKAPLSTNLLPVCTSSEKDAGPFITGGVQVVYDKEWGVHGLGIHRQRILDDKSFGCMATPERRIGHMIERYEAHAPDDDPEACVPFVTVIGAPPSVCIGSQARIPHNEDKYDVAGGIAGAPVRLCRTTFLSDIFEDAPLVPADAEMIIEGFVRKRSYYNRINDAPFSEFTGCTNIKGSAFIVEVIGITWRDEPIYLHMSTGLPVLDDHVLCGMAIEPQLQKRLMSLGIDATEVAMDEQGNNIFTAHVAVKRRTYGEPWNAAYQLLSDINIKYVFLYDDDIDVRDPRKRQWAFETRLRPDEGIITTPIIVGASLDPSCPGPFRHTSKAAFICMKPWDRETNAPLDPEKFDPCKVPGTDTEGEE